MSETYEETAELLVRRIMDLGPKIMEIDDPWQLFKAGLQCSDLQPSMYQAAWALRKAQERLRVRP